jgi:hypothetical protein
MVQYPAASAIRLPALGMVAVGKMVVGEVVVVMVVVGMVVVVVVAVVVVGMVRMFDMRMSAWLASQLVLPAPVAAKQVRSLADLGFSAVASRMAASAERVAKLARLQMAGGKAVSPDWVERRRRSQYSHHSPTGV